MKWKLSVCSECMNVKACPSNILGTHTYCGICKKEVRVINLYAEIESIEESMIVEIEP